MSRLNWNVGSSWRPAVVAALATLVLGGCGGDEPETDEAGSSTANATDIAFAQGMIPHHQQAVQMSDLVLGASPGAVDQEVMALAEQIKQAQAPEIALMQGWLDDWGAPADMEGMEGMEGMDGMLSTEQLGELEAAGGAKLERLFLTGMIDHHEGAVTMAQTELDEGSDPDALELAEDIVQTQQDEITQMETLLDR